MESFRGLGVRFEVRNNACVLTTEPERWFCLDETPGPMGCQGKPLGTGALTTFLLVYLGLLIHGFSRSHNIDTHVPSLAPHAWCCPSCHPRPLNPRVRALPPEQTQSAPVALKKFYKRCPEACTPFPPAQVFATRRAPYFYMAAEKVLHATSNISKA